MSQERILIATRTKTWSLARLSERTVRLPFPHKHYYGTSAEGYLFQVINETDFDYVVNIDEDAFVLDPILLEELIQVAKDQGYVNVGMPDGGSCPIRFHNPCVTNPFFNIFHTARLRAELPNRIRDHSLSDRISMMDRFPKEKIRGPYNLEPFEPFEDLLLEIFCIGETLWLDSSQGSDAIATVLHDPNGRPFLLHTWYARHFLTSRDARSRILTMLRSRIEFRGLVRSRDIAAIKLNIVHHSVESLAARIDRRARRVGAKLLSRPLV
jgi:hypothetical protein